jgi:cell division inhibitor SepF
MGKGIDKFMNILSLSSGDDDDYDNDDLFDDEIDLVEPPKQKQPKQKKEPRTAAKQAPQQKVQTQQTKVSSGFGSSMKSQTSAASYNNYDDDYEGASGYGKKTTKSRPRTSAASSKVVSMNGRGSEVYVIKPQDFNEAQTVTDFLKDGKAIIINMEGIELTAAQRIIDFIGGACYALDGSLQAISANIFVAAPPDIEVTGDLREELLNDSTISPNLGAF